MSAYITTEVEVSYAHRLLYPGPDGEGRRLHGHHSKIQVTVPAEGGADGEYQRAVADVRSMLHHTTLLNKEDPLLGSIAGAVGMVGLLGLESDPTPEFLAGWVYRALRDRGVPVISVVFYETSSTWAEYAEDGGQEVKGEEVVRMTGARYGQYTAHRRTIRETER